MPALSTSSEDHLVGPSGSIAMSTVGRALLILEYLGRQGTRASLSDIARRTGLPKSTAHRLLADLESHRAVERYGDRYRLGSLSQTLASRADRRYDALRRTLMPCLIDLYGQVNLSVSLAVLRHSAVIYLVTLYGPGHSQAVLRTGPSAPAHCTAAGKALLAYRLAMEQREEKDLHLVPMTDNTITSAPVFVAELARIRAEGIAYNREEYVQGLVGAASPIMRADRRPRAAITVLGLAGEFDFEAVTRKLRRSAHFASLLISRHPPKG